MSVQCCVLMIETRTGTGVQTVTDVLDRDGNAFTPAVIYFQGGNAYDPDIIWFQDGVNNAFADDRGVATATIGAGNGSGSISRFGFRSLGNGTGQRYSVLDYQADVGAGNFQGYAYVSAIRSGEFDLTFDVNARPSQFFMAVCLGGSTFNVDISTYAQNGTRTCASTPAAVFCINTVPLNSTPSVATGAGDIGGLYGWDARDSNRGLAAYTMTGSSEDGNFGGIRTDTCACSIANTGAWAADAAVVSAWGDTSITFSGASSPTGGITNIFSGVGLVAKAGSVAQPTTIGTQTIDLGIDAKWVMLVCEGYASDVAPGTTKTDHSVGWTDGTAQANFWAGESDLGSAGALSGARFITSDSLVRSSEADAGATTFQAVAELGSLGTDGLFTLNWTTVDSTPRQVIWFALGEAIPVPPTPSFHTTTFVRRRLRRSPILWSENQGLQTNVRVNLIAVDMQPGVSTQVETPDAQVMIRCSKDGGRTWTSERFISVGAIGAYMQRLNTWRWGQGRQWVVEVSTSDPVTYNLVNLYIDAEPGTS